MNHELCKHIKSSQLPLLVTPLSVHFFLVAADPIVMPNITYVHTSQHILNHPTTLGIATMKLGQGNRGFYSGPIKTATSP